MIAMHVKMSKSRHCPLRLTKFIMMHVLRLPPLPCVGFYMASLASRIRSKILRRRSLCTCRLFSKRSTQAYRWKSMDFSPKLFKTTDGGGSSSMAGSCAAVDRSSSKTWSRLASLAILTSISRCRCKSDWPDRPPHGGACHFAGLRQLRRH